MTPDFSPLRMQDLDVAVEMMSKLYAQDGLAWDREHARLVLASFLADPEAGSAWLISIDGEISGYLVLTLCYSLEFGGRFGLVDELYIEERWRGRGVGAQVLDFAETQGRARGVNVLRLEVARDNARAIALYRRRGYQAHDRDLMTKWL